MCSILAPRFWFEILHNKYMLHYLTVKVNFLLKKCDLPFPWLVKTNVYEDLTKINAEEYSKYKAIDLQKGPQTNSQNRTHLHSNPYRKIEPNL